MTVLIEFKGVLGSSDLVLFGLAGSGTVDTWQWAPPDQAVLDALDQVPWGTRPPGAPDAARQLGVLLRTKLAAIPPVKKALVDAFGNADAVMAPRPLYFRVSGPGVEAVPFEAVWDDLSDRFAGLDDRWPIARLPTDAAEPSGPFTMARSVRVIAILAAEGVDAGSQLAAMQNAIAAQPALPVEVLVFTNSLAMKTAIENGNDPNWTAELVPATPDGLIDKIRDVQPHILHVFCHGTAVGPRLLIAQLNDLAVLELTAAHFETITRPAFLAPWLVTLNCCESGAPGDQIGSLASALARAGMPAVLGMRKPVDKNMADAFCADLYRAVFARLAAIAPLGSMVSDLNWPSILCEPRRRLVSVHGAVPDVAGRQKEWTMPILYLASPTIQLRGMPTAILDDATVQQELVSLGMADSLEAHGNLTPVQADALRNQALAVLYPGG